MNVTTPKASTEYVPTFATVMEVPAPFVQFGDTSTGFEFGLHNFTDEATSETPIALVATASFSKRFFVCTTFFPADDVSGFAVGSGVAWHIAPSRGALAYV